MNAHRPTSSVDAAKAILTVTSTAMVALFTAIWRRENFMPFIPLSIFLAFSTSLIAVVHRGDCDTMAKAMERIGILTFAIVFFGLQNLALPSGYNWVPWTYCGLFFLSIPAPYIIRWHQGSDRGSYIIRWHQGSDRGSGETKREGTEMVSQSNVNDVMSPKPTNISQDLDLAKAMIGFPFLAVVVLVVITTGQIIPPHMLWFLALGNSVAFSTSILWIWHSSDFPKFAKAMKVIGVISTMLTFCVFLDHKFSSYRWVIWLSFAMLLLCLASYKMLSNIYQFITKNISKLLPSKNRECSSSVHNEQVVVEAELSTLKEVVVSPVPMIKKKFLEKNVADILGEANNQPFREVQVHNGMPKENG